MAGALQGLTKATGVVGEAWERALPPFGVMDHEDVSLLVRQMDDGGLVALLERLTDVARRADALTIAVAGELAARSPVGSAESLAHRWGYGSPAKQVAASTGGALGRAAMMTTVGQATATRRALTGEALPAKHPHVARVVQAGSVSVEAAHLIIRMLDGLSSRVAADRLEDAEVLLAEKATWFSLEDVRKLVERMEAVLDQDGVAPREEVLRQGRSVTMVQDSSGRYRLRGTFDPETGAPIKAVLDAYVTNALRVARGHNHPGAVCATEEMDASVVPETRSTAQIAADGLADFARHVLACTDRVPGLPAVNLVVRMDLEDLQATEGGCGFATIDGVEKPISVGAARRMACAAGLLPEVFGGGSQPLDLGRSRRLFSRGQVIALWERDCGCASCGQVTFVEAHHARADWVHGGKTDLADGVLLCSRCHHRVHADGWDIRIDTDGVWFIPPSSLDPARRPRPGVQRQTLRERNRHTHETHTDPPDLPDDDLV